MRIIMRASRTRLEYHDPRVQLQPTGVDWDHADPGSPARQPGRDEPYDETGGRSGKGLIHLLVDDEEF